MKKEKNIFLFDVESDGLYGEGFCFAAIVANKEGEIIEKLAFKADFEIKENWVKENVLPNLNNIETVENTRILRTKFYEFYMQHKDNCDIYSDCIYPVEANFLINVVKDECSRIWNMPYPLLDIASIKGIETSRNEFYTEKNREWIAVDSSNRSLREHNPVDDCIASLCLLLGKEIKYKRN